MTGKNLWLGMVVFFIGIAIIVNGYLVGSAIRSVNITNSRPAAIDNKVLDLPQAAQYLNMSEEKVEGIISAEKTILEKNGSFGGKMFPYFTVDNQRYFYKDEIDEWLKEVSSNRSEYNLTEGWVLN